MSVKTCDICSHKPVCRIRKAINGVLVEELAFFGPDYLPVSVRWYEFVGSECMAFVFSGKGDKL